MSAPDAPQIRIRPRATYGTLEFWWQPPLNDGGDPVSAYVLTDGGANSNDLAANARYFKQTGLTNRTEYTFTLQASNTHGLGTAATFRTVQPGFPPPAPNGVSIYRQSATAATLTWNNPATDGNTPDPWRNVVVTPLVAANGSITYPGDNTIASNAIRLFGTETRADITVVADASYNFIVRGQNDPGYSSAYDGTGSFNLGNSNYSGEAILGRLVDASYKNSFNYYVHKDLVGPVQNTNLNVTSNSVTAIWTHQRGFFTFDSNSVTGNSVGTVIDKNGFVIYKTPEFISAGIPYLTRTNPILPFVADYSIGGASSNLPVYVFDTSDNTSSVTILQQAGATLSLANFDNSRDTNAWFVINNGTSYDHYTIPSGSKTPIKRCSSSANYSLVNNKINKESFVIMKETTDSIYANILYLPNSGSHVLYDISGLNITTVTQSQPITGGKLFVDGVNVSSIRNTYTFSLPGTPSVQTRVISGAGGIGFRTTTGNSFTGFYNRFGKTIASAADLSGDFIFYALSPNSAEPALAYNGSSQTIVADIGTSEFTGSFYTDNANDIYFTGVGYSDEHASTVQLKYGPGGTPITNAFAVGSIAQYPFYTLSFFTDNGSPAINPLVILNYNSNTSTFDMSGADISGANVVSRSDNSGVNFFSVTGNANRSYYVSPSHFPPTELSNYFVNWYSTYPSGSYTLGRRDATDIFEIYNGATLDVSGTIGFIPDFSEKGPDCWYFITRNSGINVSVTRIATNGAKVSQTFSIPNDNSYYLASVTSSGILIQVYDISISKNVSISFNTTRNTFEAKILTSEMNYTMYSTYLPTINF